MKGLFRKLEACKNLYLKLLFVKKWSSMSIRLVVTLLFSLCSLDVFCRIPKEVDVLIIGAGLSGLSTAYELKKEKIKYHILELTPFIGGRVRTVKYNYFGEKITSDSGMEEYWESNPALKMIKELKLKTRDDIAASSITLQDNQYEFTEDTPELYMNKIFSEKELKSLNEFKNLVASYVPQLKKEGIDKDLLKFKDISFADWVGKQKLPKKVSEWIRVSVECEAGTEWSSFSALDGFEEFKIFLGNGERSFRIINGNEIFTDALTQAIGRNNITVNQRVTRIETIKNKVKVSFLDIATNTNQEIWANHVVSTVPPFRLIMEVQITPAPSKEKYEAISTMTYGSYFKAHLMVNKSAEKFWKRNGETILPYLSDSELGVIYEGNPDQKSKTKIISLLITGTNAETFNFMNQDQINKILKEKFEKFWPGFSKEIIDMHFYRYHPRAIGGWPVGRSRFDELSQALRTPENRLYYAGDFTEGTHSSDAVESALRVVRQIKKEKK